jgi:hypothetical protein
MPRLLSLALTVALAVAASHSARAENAVEFMERFSGKWIGTGQLLFVTTGTSEFACELKGDPSEKQLTFGMSGTCRMGSFAAPVRAQLRYNSDTREFYGEFMDGAAGSGVDLVGARAGRSLSLKLVRGSMQGRLSAETIGTDQMKVVMYYKDPKSGSEIPVVSMGFMRKELITGSIAR